MFEIREMRFAGKSTSTQLRWTTVGQFYNFYTTKTCLLQQLSPVVHDILEHRDVWQRKEARYHQLDIFDDHIDAGDTPEYAFDEVR